MVLSNLVLTCALLAVGQAPPDVVYTKLTHGRIPPEITPERLAEIKELELFMSPDLGKTWNQVDKITPDKGAFTYSTPADGEYWFHVVVVNKQGKRDPVDLYKTPPMMKVIVDTKAPVVKITSAQRQGDDLVVSWSVLEDNPDPGKLKLAYRVADSLVWTPISLTPNAEGTARVRVNTKAPLVVQLQFADRANNSAEAVVQVSGDVTAAGFNPAAVSNKAAEPAGVAVPAPDKIAVVPPPPARSPLPPLDSQNLVSTAPTPPVAVATPPQKPAPLSQPPMGAVAPMQPMQNSITQTSAPSNIATAVSIASTGDISQGSSTSLRSPSGPRTMPEVQIVSEPEIVLEFEVSKVGPSGVGKIEVWLTKDNGASWVRFAEDTDATQATNAGKYRRALLLPGEGVYGISLVVKNKAGIGRPAPKPGDFPEMLVEVDTMPPKADLLTFVPDPQNRDCLLLRWVATDRNLAATPITLEWAERPNGPWQPIAHNIANTGRQPWRLPPALPSHVYLKMTVRDNAGNVSVAVTREPQLVDLSEPEGHLLRVMPASKSGG